MQIGSLSLMMPVLVVPAADPADTLSAGLTAQLTANTKYFVVVRSHGGYGDVGWYTLDGSIPAALAPVVPPDRFVAMPTFDPVMKPPTLGPSVTDPIIKAPIAPIATFSATSVSKTSSKPVSTTAKPTGQADLGTDPFAATLKKLGM